MKERDEGFDVCLAACLTRSLWGPLKVWDKVLKQNHVSTSKRAPPLEERFPVWMTKGRVRLGIWEPKVVLYCQSCLLSKWVAVNVWVLVDRVYVCTHLGVAWVNANVDSVLLMWVCYENLCVNTKEQHQRFSMCMCVCACACVRVRKKTEPKGAGILGWPQGSVWGGGVGGAVPSCLVYDSPGHVTTCSHRSTGQSETRGQRVKPARLFIVCAECLTAECRQISPEVSASIHKCKLAWTRQDRGSTVPTCFWELAQWQWSALPPHLSVCMSPLSGSVFCCLSSWQGEEGNTSLPLFFLTQVRLQIL